MPADCMLMAMGCWPQVWAIIICHFCHNWGTFILLTWMPSYYNQVRRCCCWRAAAAGGASAALRSQPA
jgi:hypothetical protein